ncbi:MAG TPA: rhomboid family intramembrane serine protease [Bryobacteraceae bacterium]|jgi:membrane associated rhomboid family serine protease|nr:rhomboid family intramembrane serine protease [Bryobacteraceae bacterium]
MIPLRSTQRVYSKTLVTAALIAINTLIFFYQETLGPGDVDMFVRQWGIIPDQMRGAGLLTLFTSMFLHAGWLHLIGNMLFLWVFGRNVEDLIGGPSFLAFYLLAGIAAGIVQVMVNAYSRVPTIGASGAIAGVMGAYLIKFPRTRIVTLIFIFFFVTTAEIPAAFILLYWFAIQFFSGFGSLATTNYSGGGVAYFAHIGGFLVGMLLIRMFPARQRWRAWYEED